jgi:glycosyltransferase involved in cell wall biosynthesis
MRIAFHAPLKPPDHPVPSGDRAMARALLALLREGGHEPVPTGRFRSYDRTGDAARQARIERLGVRLADRLLRRIAAGLLPLPELWLTYHLYHKAPDHLGPRVVDRLDLPYLVVEGSASRHQVSGPWAAGHAASLAALRRADLVLAMTERDRQGLLEAGIAAEAVRLFPPFLDAAPFRAAARERARHRASLAERLGLDPTVPWLLAVAMMREDVKRGSYELLAEALGRLVLPEWTLLVAGDGPARPAIEPILRAACGERLRLLGELPAEALPELYAACDLFVWPAVGEAYGMALLEAQASGVPVVAGTEGGVAAVVADGITGFLVPPRDPEALARVAARLLQQPELRLRLGRAAAERVLREHDRPVATARLEAALEVARVRHAARKRRAA